MKPNNTGKSPQKCYSRVDEDMDELTEDKVKYARAKVYLHNRCFLLTAVEFVRIHYYYYPSTIL